MRRITLCVWVMMAAAAAETPRELYQKALVKERSEGKLDEAIQLYRRAAEGAGKDRALAAKALVQLGQCHEKLGQAEAQAAYERVTRNYADQKDAAEEARVRLASLRRAPGGHAGMVTRQVWAGPNVNDVGPVSADGRYLTFTDWATGNIVLHDLNTGKNRDLTNKGTYADSEEEGEESAISPDGKQVAYSWLKDLRYQLRLVGVGGNAPVTPRILYDNDENDWIGAYAWSPDGQWVAVQMQKKDRTAQIGLVNAADGTLRVLKSIDWRLATSIFFSPDGKYVAYDMPASEESEQRDVFVLAVDGTREIAAVAHPAYDVAMGWTPDGRHMLFASDRSGAMGIWALPIRDGKLQGTPELIKSDIGQPWPLGVTRSGALYYGVRPRGEDLYLASIDFRSGEVLSPPVRPVDKFVGVNRSPDWSPDGKYLAYQSRRDPAGSRFDILAIRSVESGEVKELRPNMSWFWQPRWAPDGRSVAVQGVDRKARQGIYRIDVANGDVSAIAVGQPGEYMLQPQWAPDGSRIYFRFENQARKEYALVERELASGRERELVHSKTEPFPLSLSPDGRYLAFCFRQSTLMVLPVEGGEPRELLRLQKPQEFWNFLVWTPDSRSILFRKNLSPTFGDGGELWLVSLDGSEPRRVGLNIENVQDLRFQPQTGKIAFTGGRVSGEVWVMENFLPLLNAKR